MLSLRLSLLAVLGSSVLLAQSESGRAALEGAVADASAQAVRDALIVAHETQTGLTRTVSTNGEGHFRLGALPVGQYRVEVSAPGFAKAVVEEVSLMVGETKTLHVSLQVSSVNTEITVVADAQIVNQNDAANTISINARAIEDLPIRGRNFTEFVQLAPNVTQE